MKQDVKRPMLGTLRQHEKFSRPASSDKPIYFIGPFGSRVSFASQQQRALDLVGSLVELGTITAETEVVVVGAGLAGLTATAALHMLGGNVRLYESRSGVLKLQEDSSHRYVHPTVNFWPLEAPPSRLTNLPFLDWYSSACPNVIRALRHQWEGPNQAAGQSHDHRALPTILGELYRKPLFGWNLAFKGMDGDKVVLHDTARSRAEVRADVVLVAIGFGAEDTLGDPRQKRYWDRDDLEDMARQDGHDVLVSGAGDGGLIECLRLVFRGFKKGDFALDVIGALEAGPRALAPRLKTLEEACSKIKDDRARAAAFKQGYDEILEGFESGAAARLLNTSLVTRDPETGKYPNRVRLIARFGEPFELTAAPINRFLLAYALKKGAVERIAGKLETVPARRRGVVDQPPPDLFRVVDDDGEVEDVDESQTHLIIRHGPAQALQGFLDDVDEVDDLRRQQQLAGDFASEPHFEPSYFIPPTNPYPSLKSDPRRYAATRREIAREFMSERYNRVIRLVHPARATPVFEVVASAEREGGAPDEAEPLPAELWGVTVRERLRTGIDTPEFPDAH